MEANTQGGLSSHSDFSTESSTGAHSAQDTASSLSDKAQDALATVKEMASYLPGMLADRLESGAEKLRSSPTPSGAMAGGGSAALANDTPVSQAKDTLAKGMQSSADWLRDANFDKIRDGIEQEVKERPTRSLLIALGVGYLLGKAIRS